MNLPAEDQRLTELVTGERWLTVAEAAAYLRVSRDTIYRDWRRVGGVTLGNRPRAPVRLRRDLIDAALGVEQPQPVEPGSVPRSIAHLTASCAPHWYCSGWGARSPIHLGRFGKPCLVCGDLHLAQQPDGATMTCMSVNDSQTFDAPPPPEMARRAEAVGEAKAALPAVAMFALGVLAGAFIAMGAAFATTVTAGTSGLAYGVVRLLAGVAFSLGLILVIVGGAELFTGNTLMIMAWAGRRISTARMLRNWVIVYAGNMVGAAAAVLLMVWAKQYTFGNGAVGVQALTIGAAKTDLGFGQAVALGILCNALVCIAVWLCFSARTTADRILAIVPPIAAFVASGFEHSVANMYFIPVALLIKRDHAWVNSMSDVPDLHTLTWNNYLVDNLLPVTIGNLIGGTLLVGAVYWFIYLRQP